MSTTKKLPWGMLPAGPDSTPFFISRFQGRKKAINHGHHRHRFLELIIIEEGSGSHFLEGKEAKAARGDVFVISPGESHNPDGLENTLHWVVAFDMGFISRKSRSEYSLYSGLPGEVVLLGFARASETAFTQFKLPEDQLSEWLSTFKRAEEELKKRKLGYVECAQALLSLILIDVARLTAAEINYSAGKSRTVLAAFFAYLEEGFKRKINLSTIAKALRLSPAYLTDLLKKETGKTVMEWVRARRISEAKFLLRESHQSIKEVAFESGYADANLLIRHFKQETGLSPKAWKSGIIP